MNQSSPTDDLRTGPVEDNLDRLLSEFFHSKMQQPWPAAPLTIARVPASEPSVLVAARTATHTAAEAPRNQPAAAARGGQRDQGSRARYTLAVSFALLLGTCWYLSNGFQPGERSGSGSPGGFNTPGLLKDAGAADPTALKELRKDKATKGNEGFAPTKIKLP